MKKIEINCCCNDKIPILNWNEHSSKCSAYTNKIQSDIKKSVTHNIDSNNNKTNTVNRSTFQCPLCENNNLDRESLISHVKKSHRNAHAVCPICACQPWGDKNYITHLLGHLNKRHLFEYDTTVDYNEEEDEVLKRVLAESMNVI